MNQHEGWIDGAQLHISAIQALPLRSLGTDAMVAETRAVWRSPYYSSRPWPLRTHDAANHEFAENWAASSRFNLQSQRIYIPRTAPLHFLSTCTLR